MLPSTPRHDDPAQKYGSALCDHELRQDTSCELSYTWPRQHVHVLEG